MNLADDLRVQTVGGADRVRIHSVTGPTLVDTGAGDDVIELTGLTLTYGKLDTTNGGAILLADETLTTNDVAFVNNSAVDRGGAIFAALSGAIANINNSSFTGNTATNIGGAITIGSGSLGSILTVVNSTFTNNSAGNQGGAIQGGSTISVNISGNTFTQNTAVNGGGALNLGVGTMTINTSTFSNNTSTVANAGAINLPSVGTTATITDCIITNNGTLTTGGGINSTATGQTLTITRTTISGNVAGTTGGGIYAITTNLSVIDSTVNGNTANGPTTGGGGININAIGTLNLTNSTISGNTAAGVTAIGGSVRTAGYATLTFSGTTAVDFGSLADSVYTLTALASAISSPGGLLDGDGNATAGDNYVLVGSTSDALKLFRYFGDSDGDGDVDNSDFTVFRSAFGTGDSIFTPTATATRTSPTSRRSAGGSARRCRNKHRFIGSPTASRNAAKSV